MGTTIYASFVDASNAEKAVGALLDNHVRAEDITVLTGREGTYFRTEYDQGSNTAVTTRVTDEGVSSGDIDRPAKPACRPRPRPMPRRARPKVPVGAPRWGSWQASHRLPSRDSESYSAAGRSRPPSERPSPPPGPGRSPERSPVI